MSAHYIKWSRCLASNSNRRTLLDLSIPCQGQGGLLLLWRNPQNLSTPLRRSISINISNNNNNMEDDKIRYYHDGIWWKSSLRSLTTTPNANNGGVEVTNTSKMNAGNSNNKTQPSGGQRRQQHQQVEEHIVNLNGQMRIQYRHADYRGALETCKVVLEECEAFYPSDEHPAIASAHVNIGLMLKQLGEYDDARTHYQKALDMYASLVGTDHASYAAALHNMGTLDRAQSQQLAINNNYTDNDDESTITNQSNDDDTNKQSWKWNQSAIKYFQQALEIRTAELGEDHAYTITTRSALGATLASQVLAAPHLKKSSDSNDDEDYTTNNPTTILSNNEQWQVAQEHLEKSLQLATSNPRGPQIQISTTTVNNHSVKRRDKSKSKKERRELSKQQKKQRYKNSPNTSTNCDVGGNEKVTTMAAANAAQNLAIFYKYRADVTNDYDLYVQAESLYRSALRVRTQLLPSPSTHPSVLETKFSLAELYSAMKKETEAQTLREEILSAYDIQEKDM